MSASFPEWFDLDLQDRWKQAIKNAQDAHAKSANGKLLVSEYPTFSAIAYSIGDRKGIIQLPPAGWTHADLQDVLRLHRSLELVNPGVDVQTLFVGWLVKHIERATKSNDQTDDFFWPDGNLFVEGYHPSPFAESPPNCPNLFIVDQIDGQNRVSPFRIGV